MNIHPEVLLSHIRYTDISLRKLDRAKHLIPKSNLEAIIKVGEAEEALVGAKINLKFASQVGHPVPREQGVDDAIEDFKQADRSLTEALSLFSDYTIEQMILINLREARSETIDQVLALSR